MRPRRGASLFLTALVLGACGRPAAPQNDPAPARVNHEGRALPPPPALTKPVLFNTPEADAVLSSLQIFPKDSPWNEDITDRPVHPDSDRIIDSVGRNLRFRWNHDMAFILVPPDQ